MTFLISNYISSTSKLISTVSVVRFQTWQKPKTGFGTPLGRRTQTDLVGQIADSGVSALCRLPRRCSSSKISFPRNGERLETENTAFRVTFDSTFFADNSTRNLSLKFETDNSKTATFYTTEKFQIRTIEAEEISEKRRDPREIFTRRVASCIHAAI